MLSAFQDHTWWGSLSFRATIGGAQCPSVTPSGAVFFWAKPNMSSVSFRAILGRAQLPTGPYLAELNILQVLWAHTVAPHMLSSVPKSILKSLFLFLLLAFLLCIGAMPGAAHHLALTLGRDHSLRRPSGVSGIEPESHARQETYFLLSYAPSQ